MLHRLQQNASHPDTFTPHYLSFEHLEYISMVNALHLPYRLIESTSCVGPFFWAAWDQDEENPHLRRFIFLCASVCLLE